MSRSVAALAVALSVLILGCGDTGGGETVAATGIAKSAYLKKADAICDETYERIQAEYVAFARPRHGRPIDDFASIKRYAETVLIPEKARQVEELRALGAPAGDEAEVEAILDAYEEGIGIAEENPSAAVSSSFGVFDKATELTQAYGLERCLY